jgi:hypothetical protein
LNVGREVTTRTAGERSAMIVFSATNDWGESVSRSLYEQYGLAVTAAPSNLGTRDTKTIETVDDDQASSQLAYAHRAGPPNPGTTHTAQVETVDNDAISSLQFVQTLTGGAPPATALTATIETTDEDAAGQHGVVQ